MGTLEFYDADPEGYFDRTFRRNVSSSLERFASRLPEGARILDLGCGSCRDTLRFRDMGFDVVPADGSEGMRRVAKERLGIDVVPMRFDELPWIEEFDGVWACSSLLHVPSADIPLIFSLIRRSLRPDGVFFCSFKRGDFEGERDGRRYTDMTSDRLHTVLTSSGFAVSDVWEEVGSDGTAWVNAISVRQRYHTLPRWRLHEDGWESRDRRHRR